MATLSQYCRVTRLQVQLLTVLFTLFTATLGAGACTSACATYHTQLQYVATLYSPNVNTLGDAFPSGEVIQIINNMCPSNSAIQSCNQCLQKQTPMGTSKSEMLAMGWAYTCQTWQSNAASVSKAYACWRGLPSHSACSSLSAAGGGSGNSMTTVATGSKMSMSMAASMASGSSSGMAKATMSTSMMMSSSAMATGASSAAASMASSMAASMAASGSASGSAAASSASASAAAALPNEFTNGQKIGLIVGIVIAMVICLAAVIALMIVKRKPRYE